MAHVRRSIRIEAPIDYVFERLVDHEAMTDWPGVGRSKLVVDGAPTRNGLGAVRAISALGLTLHEEVVHFESPVRYDYKIVRGLPVEHLGTVRLAALSDSVELTWEIDLESDWPLLGRLVARLLGQKLPAALAYFKRDTEQRYTGATRADAGSVPAASRTT